MAASEGMGGEPGYARVVQLSYMKNLFASRKWHDLVPDQTHTVLTAGYDAFSCNVGKIRGPR